MPMCRVKCNETLMMCWSLEWNEQGEKRECQKKRRFEKRMGEEIV